MKVKEKVVRKLEGELRECGQCQDGVLLVYNANKDIVEVQKCDECCMFDSDIEAWKSVKPEWGKDES